MPTKNITTLIPFVRNEDGRTTTIAILKVVTDHQMTPEQIMGAMKRLLTNWVNETKDGKQVWKYTGGDMNIGDFAQYETSFGEWIPHSSLKAYGIINFEIVALVDSTEALPFDKILVDPEGVTLE